MKSILPQRFPMLMLTNIESYDLSLGFLIAKIDTSSNNIFYSNEIEGISTCLGIEYLAQAAGAFCGILEPSIDSLDLILEVKRFVICRQFLKNKMNYFVKIVMKDKIGGLAKFQGIIFDEEKKVYARATLKIYRTEQIS